MSDCYDCEKFKDNMPCYDDYRFCEKSLAEHDKQIRADAIDEFKNKLYERARDKGVYASEYIAFIDCTFEQLKEQKNEPR